MDILMDERIVHPSVGNGVGLGLEARVGAREGESYLFGLSRREWAELKEWLPSLPLPSRIEHKRRAWAAGLAGILREIDHPKPVERPVIVFRPAGDAWEIGDQVHASCPRVLGLAHRVIREGAVRVPDHDLARRRLRRAARWIERETTCTALAKVLRHMPAAKGVVYWRPGPYAPRFVTA